MVTSSSSPLQAKLRNLVTDFLGSRGRNISPPSEIIESIRNRKWRAVLFGGTLRDLMVLGPARPPRDIDIVIDEVSRDEIRKEFEGYVYRYTRFGGLTLRTAGWFVDVWPLRDTWAIKNSLVNSVDFASLPKTTFLNVEAVCVELKPSPGKSRVIYAKGFFEAICEQIVEINLEENPFPSLCIVRSLLTAAKLNYKIGPKLMMYLMHHAYKHDFEELISIQLSHYGQVSCTLEQLADWLTCIRAQYRTSKTSAAQLPIRPAQQLRLWQSGDTRKHLDSGVGMQTVD